MNNELKWVSTSNTFVVDGEKILVIKRPMDAQDFPGWYMLPGGKQEFNETILQTAIRETIEETGITPINPTLRVIATHLHDYKSKVYIVNIFEAKEFQGELISSKEGEVRWMNIEDLVNSPMLYPDLKRHLKIILESANSNVIFTYHKFDENLNIVEER